jgi:hypothetical protein
MPEPNTCVVCARPDVAALDAALDAGEAVIATARRFGIARTTLQRHAKHRGGKPGGLPVEADAAHVEAEPASSPLPAPAPRLSSPHPAPPAPPPADPLPSSAPSPDPAPAEPPGKVIAFPNGRVRPGPGRRCACCSSEHWQAIDAAIGAGMSYRGIERRYGVSDDSARHHATECVPEALARAADGRAAAEAQTVDTVLEEVTRLLTEARDALAAATADGEASHKDRATWFRELRQTVELLAKLRGELTAASVEVNIIQDPRFKETLGVIFRALGPFPGARQAALVALEGGA